MSDVLAQEEDADELVSGCASPNKTSQFFKRANQNSAQFHKNIHAFRPFPCSYLEDGWRRLVLLESEKGGS